MKKTRKSPVLAMLTALSLMVSIGAGGTMGRTPGQSLSKDSKRSSEANQKTNKDYPSLTRYATDLTKLARQGRLEVASEKSAGVRRLVKILSNETGRNPVPVNSSENMMSAAIAGGLAQRIAASDVPESLLDKRVFNLNPDALFAGSKEANVFAARLKAILNETADSRGSVILFVNELHQFVGTYANEQISAALRDALEHGQVRLIGSATMAAYAEWATA